MEMMTDEGGEKGKKHCATISRFWLFFMIMANVALAKNTTDPAEARVINEMFSAWGIKESAVTNMGWNISGELCSGAAVNSTDFEKYNPAIKCDCNFPNSTCHITQLKVYAMDAAGPIPEGLWTLTYLTNLYVGLRIYICTSIQAVNPTSGIRARFRELSGYLGSIKKDSLLFSFWKEQKGDSVWATRMTGAKFDIEKFDGTGDFGLWRVKMRALLIQHGCEAALEVLPADMEAEAKAELNKKAHNGDLVKARDFVHDKVIGQQVVLKKKLYTFYIAAGRKISEHIDEFNKIVLDLANIEDHLKRNCPKNNRKKSKGYSKKDEQPSSSGSTYDDFKVMMVMSAQDMLDWIIDSECSYHMTPRYISELKRNLISLGTLKKEGYTIKLQSGKVNVINGSRVVLSRIRRDNCAYSLDGHAVAGELNASVEEKDSLAQVWHKRLGNISEAGLHVLEKQGLFGKKSLDLWGPSQVESLGGKRYFLSIVDDYSRRTPMEMWSGHPSDYGMLRIFECVTYLHDKQGTDKSIEELQVEVELQRLNNHTLKEDQTNQEDGDDEDAEDQETD
ncbi:hypothetical protein Tco_0775592 [Tanacetum coccineum]